MKANLTKFCYLLNSRIIVNSFILSPRQSCLVQVINLSNKIPSQHEREPGKLKKKKLKLLLFLIWMLSKQQPQLTPSIPARRWAAPAPATHPVTDTRSCRVTLPLSYSPTLWQWSRTSRSSLSVEISHPVAATNGFQGWIIAMQFLLINTC